MKKNRTLIFAVIALCICIIFSGAFILKGSSESAGDLAATTSSDLAATTKSDVAEASSSESDSSESEGAVKATLFLASDYQQEEGWKSPGDTLSNILDVVKDDGKEITGAIICGDYTNIENQYDYQLSPEESISEIKEITKSKCPKLDDNITFIQGNHDKLTESISSSGLHEFDDYLVYVVNTQGDFPWRQGAVSGCLEKVQKTSQAMKNCFDSLIAKGETRPIIIAGHVPLHYTARTSSRHTTGDNLYSSLIFDVVNEAAEDLNIIYLTGHNHSKGWDCYMGGSAFFKAKGESILLPEYEKNDVTTDKYQERTLNFTYMNAGYIGYYSNCSLDEIRNGRADQYQAADMTLTGTVCEIYDDRIVLTRYSEEGIHQIGSDGCADPYKDGIDKGLIPADKYNKAVQSPQKIVLLK